MDFDFFTFTLNLREWIPGALTGATVFSSIITAAGCYRLFRYCQKRIRVRNAASVVEKQEFEKEKSKQIQARFEQHFFAAMKVVEPEWRKFFEKMVGLGYFSLAVESIVVFCSRNTGSDGEPLPQLSVAGARWLITWITDEDVAGPDDDDDDDWTDLQRRRVDTVSAAISPYVVCYSSGRWEPGERIETPPDENSSDEPAEEIKNSSDEPAEEIKAEEPTREEDFIRQSIKKELSDLLAKYVEYHHDTRRDVRGCETKA